MTGKTNSVVFPAAHIEFAATVGDNTLHLRTQTAGFDCTIYWGDGQKTVAPINGGNIIHNYAQAGVYHIFIVGKSFAGFNVSNQVGKEKYTALHSMGRWVNDTITSMANSFYGCSGLTVVSAGALQYATAATNFTSCFRSTGLTTLPLSLFKYNTAATTFANCFYGSLLVSLPDEIFRYNTAATSFVSCFQANPDLANVPYGLFQYNFAAVTFTNCFFGCYKLSLREDMFGHDYANRFAGKTVILINCFSRTSFTGTQGTAPQLWNFTYGSVTRAGCFAGAGNSETSLSNYADIPTDWK